MPGQTYRTEPWLVCLSCNAPIPARLENIRLYFSGTNLACPKCHTINDTWNTYLEAINENFMANAAYGAIGASGTIIRETLKRDQPLEITFEDHGIPSGARILQIIYASVGKLVAVELHGNLSTGRRRSHDKVILWPRPLGDDPPNEAILNIFITWIDEDRDTESILHLADACEAFSHDRYSEAVIPANISVEVETSRLISDVLSRSSSRERVSQFLSNQATYSGQLNILLPFIAQTHNKQVLPDAIVGHLNRLRKLRNEIAHQGALSSSIDKRNASEIICSALFGFAYMGWLRNELQLDES